MSDRGRPHNIGQALFESLGAGLGAFGSFLEQERIRKSETQQQSFLNRIRIESGERAQGQLDLAQSTFDLSQDKFGFEQEKFNIQQEIDPIEQSLIDFRGAQQSAAEALAVQRGQGGGKVTANTFNTIFGELGLGFKQRELTRQFEARNPAFGEIVQEEEPLNFFENIGAGLGFFTPETTDVFKPRRDISPDEISIPPDTLTALLQQARQIAGGTQLAPSTNLSDLGKEAVFPRTGFGELAQQPELQQKRIESRQRAIEWADKNLPKWRELSPKDQEEYLQSVEFRLQQ